MRGCVPTTSLDGSRSSRNRPFRKEDLPARLCRTLAGAAALALACLIGGPGRALTRGTTGADFLKIATGVRAVSMGGSFVAIGEDVYSVYWNPAGIANLQAPEAAGSYVKLFDRVDGISMLSAACEIPRFPGGYGNSAVGLLWLTTGSFDSTDPAALVRAASGAASDLMTFVSYAAPVSEGLSAGGGLKVVRRALTGADPTSFVADPVTGDQVPTRSIDYQAGGVGVDVGVLWENLERTISAGASVQNIGKMGAFQEGFGMSMGGGSELLPVTFRTGAAIKVRLWGHQLLSSADLTSYIDSFTKPRLSVGAEYSIMGMAFLRLGWEQPLDAPLGRTALDFGARSGVAALPSPMRTGIGFRAPVGTSSLVQVDYALAPFGTLGAVHHVAMLVRWNIPKSPRAVTAGAPVQVDTRKVKPALVIEPKQIKFEQAPKEWKVEIKDDRGRVVKTFSGLGLPPKALDWDGVDDRGKIMTDLSNLKFSLTAKDIGNKVVRTGSSIASVTAEPQLKAVAGKPLYPEVVFVLPQGNYQLWQVQIQDAGRLVRSWEGQGRPDSPLKWDGKDQAGRSVKLDKPKYSWEFVSEEGQKIKGERKLPQVEADVRPEAAANRVRLIGVRFRGTASDLTDDHQLVMKKAAAFLAEHPDSSLVIESYADVAGGDEESYLLGRSRAEKVLHALTEDYQIRAARVTMRIYGRSKAPPSYPNVPEEEQRQRVDLVINVRR